MTHLVCGGVTAALFLLLTAVPVLAHAELEESDPADGESIDTPYTLTATFNEEIGTDRSRIEVENTAGEQVARGGISPGDSTVMTVELPELEPGDYTAFWTAVTPDDNGVTRGEIHFNVAEAATPPPTAGPTAAPTPPSSTAPDATALPTPAPTPAETSDGTNGSPAAGGNDILLALALAAAVLLGLGLYLFTRSRR